jgi:hypothetical protein
MVRIDLAAASYPDADAKVIWSVLGQVIHGQM